MTRRFILGTRGSDLALWQAKHIQALLREGSGLATEIRILHTVGDRSGERSLASLPGSGFFTREIEAALLREEIDLAVHSHKDLPTEVPPGLAIVAIPARGPAEECLLVRPEAWCEPTTEASLLPLRSGAVVGTGSARRAAQMVDLRGDLRIRDLRGNVPTRIGKLAAGEYDAIVLAKAGLERLGLDPEPLRIREFSCDEFVPAPAQGALAVQMREGAAALAEDSKLARAVAGLHHAPTARRVAAERALLAALEGGCNLPLGAHATLSGEDIKLLAVLGQAGGGLRRCEVTADTPAAAAARALAALTPSGRLGGASTGNRSS